MMQLHKSVRVLVHSCHDELTWDMSLSQRQMVESASLAIRVYHAFNMHACAFHQGDGSPISCCSCSMTALGVIDLVMLTLPIDLALLHTLQLEFWRHRSRWKLLF